jgi:hypothetical protein
MAVKLKEIYEEKEIMSAQLDLIDEGVDGSKGELIVGVHGSPKTKKKSSG